MLSIRPISAECLPIGVASFRLRNLNGDAPGEALGINGTFCVYTEFKNA